MLKGSIAIFLGLMAFCVGCGQEASTEVEVSRSPAELVDEAIAGSKEFNFLLSEDAGSESFKECADQIKATLDSLSESLGSSGLEQTKADQLSAAVEKVTAAYDKFAGAVTSNAPAAKMSKANSAFHKELKAISNLFR